LIRFEKNQNLASSKAFDLLRLWASIDKHPSTHALMARQSSLQQFKTNCQKMHFLFLKRVKITKRWGLCPQGAYAESALGHFKCMC